MSIRLTQVIARWVSKKHLPRHLREWNYRFNRRRGDVLGWVLNRMATKPTITYEMLTT